MDREDSSAPANDGPFAGDPLGLAVEQLFQASLELHGALTLVSHPVALRRARHALELMDQAVGSIRHGVMERDPDSAGHELANMISHQAGGFDPRGLTDWFGHLPSVDGVAVTLNGRLADDLVLSASSEPGRRGAVARLAAAHGPGEHARTTGRSVAAADLWAADGPWPELAESSREAGLRCAYAVPIRFGEDVFGSLDLFSVHADGLDPAAAQAADTLAVAAAVGIIRHRSGGFRAADHAEDLRAGLGELIVFQRAAGALAAQCEFGVEEATERMIDYAHRQGLRTAVVASLVLEGAEGVMAALARPDLSGN